MNDDTIKLLRECNAGIKMGIEGIDDVLADVKNPELKKLLVESRDAHKKLGKETRSYLEKYQDDGKEPAMMAKVMSKVKAELKTMAEDADPQIADFMLDGCNMGVKALGRYLNQYPTAIDEVRGLTGRIILEEQNLAKSLLIYL